MILTTQFDIMFLILILFPLSSITAPLNVANKFDSTVEASPENNSSIALLLEADENVLNETYSNISVSTDAENYLVRYGYLRPSVGRSGANTPEKRESDYNSGLMQFQRKAGIPVTGVLDEATKLALAGARCGVPDDGSRGLSSARSGSDTNWHRHQFTWAITKYTNRMSHNEQLKAMEEAFKTWSQVANLTFLRVSEKSQFIDIDIKFGSEDHGDGYPFDGRSGVLAHAWGPSDGRTHFDDDEGWLFLKHKSDGGQTKDLITVAVHELGHALGLRHAEQTAGSVMAPWYWELHDKNEKVISKLNDNDIFRIQSLYGPSKEWVDDGKIFTTSTTPTPTTTSESTTTTLRPKTTRTTPRPTEPSRGPTTQTTTLQPKTVEPNRPRVLPKSLPIAKGTTTKFCRPFEAMVSFPGRLHLGEQEWLIYVFSGESVLQLHRTGLVEIGNLHDFFPGFPQHKTVNFGAVYNEVDDNIILFSQDYSDGSISHYGYRYHYDEPFEQLTYLQGPVSLRYNGVTQIAQPKAVLQDYNWRIFMMDGLGQFVHWDDFYNISLGPRKNTRDYYNEIMDTSISSIHLNQELYHYDGENFHKMTDDGFSILESIPLDQMLNCVY